jgi:hypothetical protein
VTFGNVGLAYRQRAQLLPWLIIIAMVGLERRALKRRMKQLRLVSEVNVARNKRLFPAQLPLENLPTSGCDTVA